MQRNIFWHFSIFFWQQSISSILRTKILKCTKCRKMSNLLDISYFRFKRIRIKCRISKKIFTSWRFYSSTFIRKMTREIDLCWKNYVILSKNFKSWPLRDLRITIKNQTNSIMLMLPSKLPNLYKTFLRGVKGVGKKFLKWDIKIAYSV